MTRKRKRALDVSCSSKQPKLSADKKRTRSSVLAYCYPKVLTLREYFLTRLPITSNIRRKKLEQRDESERRQHLLDTCLVGVLADATPDIQQERAREFVAFTQTQASASGSRTDRGQSCSLDEIVDFVVWLLFKKCPLTLSRPSHLLCSGLQKGAVSQWQHGDCDTTPVIPGIYQQHPNDSLRMLKRSPWDQYLSLLGVNGEAIFSSLLLDCGLFLQLGDGRANFLQISGTPVTDLKVVPVARELRANQLQFPDPPILSRKPTEISFVRNRILYAKPSLNKNGNVQFGLKHVHVMQRYAALDQPEHTTHVMKHIFPRQFGLHNVFTSRTDPRESSHRFLDYTYREQELRDESRHHRSWRPRRLRGAVEQLVHKLRQRHARCSHTQLLRYYCSTNPSTTASALATESPDYLDASGSTTFMTQLQTSTPSRSASSLHAVQPEASLSLIPYVTPSSHVSAFCRSVIAQVLPKNCFGSGVDGEYNWSILLNSVDRFVKMRRFETLTLHEVSNRFRIRCIVWLCHSKLQSQAKLSKSDIDKRVEILQEFLYYIFDSLLMPLIRSSFYVTESGVHRNKMFFFRHDVWRKLSEPSLAVLRLNLYQQQKPKEVRHIFDSRTLGYSNMRLLPKAQGARPITNLKRRMLRLQSNRRVLGPSINAQLGPIHSALGYERQHRPSRLGGAIFSIGGLHDKLKEFKSAIPEDQRLYFVKVDIESCFDNIPQSRLIETIRSIIKADQYRTTRYSEVKGSTSNAARATARLRQKFASLARPANEGAAFSETVAADIARRKDGVVLVQTGNQKIWQQHQLLKLLTEHVQSNIVKIGKKHFKQTNGIPQGSVLSSILCSFFYSEFELKCLDFLRPSSSLLVRLIDDFLLMTTNKKQAIQFLQVMTAGNEAYGISVNQDKTLANFELQSGVHRILRNPSRDEFPFCGMMIDTTTLEVRKDWQRKDTFVNNGLTVDLGRRAGATFRRKVLLSFKMQMHALLLDTELNSHGRILATYLEAFEETAMKMHQYIRNMPPLTRPAAATTHNLILELITVGSKIGQKRQSSSASSQVQSPVTWTQVCWTASIAFERVLAPKQTEYKGVLKWLRSLRSEYETRLGMSRNSLRRIVDDTLKRRVSHGCVY